MKKRAMKKHIPYGMYCHGHLVADKDTGAFNAPDMCPYWKPMGTLVLNRDAEEAKRIAAGRGNAVSAECEFANTCTKECWQGRENACETKIVRCEYLGVTDYEEDTLLWDQCKICDVHIEKGGK